MFHNCLYLQSGGPSAVINSTFQGLRDAYQKNREGKLFVSPYGISGLLNEELIDKSDDTEDYSFLPGAHFGSLRKMLPEEVDAPIGKEIIEKLKKYEISHLFLNGGNDSMDTAYKIQRYFDYYGYQGTVLGLPKTIDNDLFGTDHTPGYGTAAKFVANATLAIYDDEYTYRKGKIIVIETMGRDSGYVAASAKLCALRGKDPDYIYVPEVPFDISSFLDKAIKTYQEKGHCIIVLSEGIRNQEGKLISDSQKDDAFGNRIVGGVSNYLTSLLLEKGYPARNIIFNTLNRSSSFLPSLTDINEARMVGSFAYEKALEGKSDFMVSIQRKESQKYEIELSLFPLAKCRKEASSFPTSYIAKSNDQIDDSFLSYVFPLIQGNALPLEDDGLLPK